MATIYLSLSKKTDTNRFKEIRIRFKHGKIDQQSKTNIFVLPDYWDNENQQITVPNFRIATPEKKELKQYLADQSERLNTLTATILTLFNGADKSDISSEWLKVTVDKFNFPEKYIIKETTSAKSSFFVVFDEYLSKKDFPKVTKDHLLVLKRALLRYEMFVSEYEGAPFVWDIDTMTAQVIEDFESFLRNEHTLYDEYRDMYDKFPAITNSKRKTHRPRQRGQNTINNLLRKLRMFVNWCTSAQELENKYRFFDNGEMREVHLNTAHAVGGTYIPNAQFHLARFENDPFRVAVSITNVPIIQIQRHTITVIRLSDNATMFEGSSDFSRPSDAVSLTITLNPVAAASSPIEASLITHRVFSRSVYGHDISGNVGEDFWDIPQDDIVSRNPNFAFVRPVLLGWGNNGFLGIWNGISGEQTQWGRREDDSYYTQMEMNDSVYFPVARSRWGWASLWFRFMDVYASMELNRRALFILRDARPIHSVINALLKAIDTDITFENNTAHSQILYGNVEGFNNDPIFITQKTNILNSNHDQPAQRAPITLGNVFALLRDTMQLYWFLDDKDGYKLRIEHISYFQNGRSYTDKPQISIDLNKIYKTKIPKKWGYLTNKYDFDTSDIPSRLQFHWADSSSDVFAGYPIEPISNFVQRGRVEDIHIRGFSADIDLMLSNPNEFNNDGFAVMKARRIDNRNVLPFETTGNHEAQNAFMSFYWLHKEFWKHNLPTRQARINNEVVERSGKSKVCFVE